MATTRPWLLRVRCVWAPCAAVAVRSLGRKRSAGRWPRAPGAWLHAAPTHSPSLEKESLRMNRSKKGRSKKNWNFKPKLLLQNSTSEVKFQLKMRNLKG